MTVVQDTKVVPNLLFYMLHRRESLHEFQKRWEKMEEKHIQLIEGKMWHIREVLLCKQAV